MTVARNIMLRLLNQIYEFGEFRLDVSEKLLSSANRRIPLSPKIFEMLRVFLESDGKLVTKDDLMNKVWADNFVEESNLTFYDSPTGNDYSGNHAGSQC